MIHASIHEFGGDEFVTNIRIYLRDDSGTGIRNVIVRASDGFTITAVSPNAPECPEEYTIELTGIERTRLPLIVEAVDCSGGETEEIPLPPLPPIPCDTSSIRGVENPGCGSAGREVTQLRNEILELCSQISALQDESDRLLATATALTATFVALLLTAAAAATIPVIGQAIAGLLAGIAAVVFLVAAATWVKYADALNRLNSAQEDMRNARANFSSAVENAMRMCCPGDSVPNLEQPECP